MIANLGLLMCIAFVPFPTRLVAEHIRDGDARGAALAYGFTLTVTAIFFSDRLVLRGARTASAPGRLRSARRRRDLPQLPPRRPASTWPRR